MWKADGNPSSTNPPRRLSSLLLLAMSFVPSIARTQTIVQATTVPLLLPGGLAYDTAGNLYFAETAAHLVRRVSTNGSLTVIAGTGTQGFGGDGGAATAAMLDSPSAVALDTAGDLFIADTHNHRIRRVDAVSGNISTFAGTGIAGASPDGTAAVAAAIDLPVALILDAAGDLFFADAAVHRVRRIDATTGLMRTVAGNGIQGYSGDGGQALSAEIDSPWGIALDGAGNLFLADTHNHRVRRVDAASGVITTVAGNGQPGFAGDAGAAAHAQIDLPRGLALDATGNLWIVDSLNQRIRRVDAATGKITVVAGDGIQGFSGDGSAATSAALDTPRAITLGQGSLPVFSDSGNGRVRDVDSTAVIHTLAGLGTTGAVTLTLSAPSVVLYGSGAVTATLAASPATGCVTFFDTPAGAAQPVMLGSAALQSNVASDSTATLAAGTHSLTASYPGDSTHSPAASDAIALTIAPAPANVVVNPAAMLYGQSAPTLMGTLTGILPQDTGTAVLSLKTVAGQTSAPGAYSISATLTGSAAGNYTLTSNAAAVTITKAPVTVSLPASLTAQVVSTTSGTPTGIVDLLDGGTLFAVGQVGANGSAAFSSVAMSAGSHTLMARYGGDGNFLSGSSTPTIITIGAATTPDFTLVSTGANGVTVPSGNAAVFAFAVNPVNGGLSSPIQMTVSGLPTGATASFSPAYLPPGSGASNVTLTIQTTKLAAAPALSPLIFATLIPVCFCGRKRRHAGFALVALVLLSGCGARVNEGSTATSTRSYNLIVIATSTSAVGSTVQHSAAITLTLE